MSVRANQANQLKSSAFRIDKDLADDTKAVLSEEERANLRFLKATKETPVTELKDAKEVADWLNDPDED